MADTSFDLVVIGAGPGGYHAAIRGAQLGLSVAVVEKDDGSGIGGLGGVCLNWGCIPSKSLIGVGNLVEKARHFGSMGVVKGELSVDFEKLQEWKRTVVERLTGGVQMLLKKNKVSLLTGTARFVGPHELEVDGGEGATRRVKAQAIIIATGSRPIEIPGFAIDGVDVISSREALDLTEGPKRLAVIGGGIIGLEIGTFYAKTGSELTVIELLPTLLPGTDPDLTKVVTRNLKKRKAKILLEAGASGYKKTDTGLVIEGTRKGEPFTVEADKILLSVGVRPNTEALGLADIGVETDRRGHIVVNERLESSVKGVHAIGDCTPGPYLAHRASKEGIIAAEAIAGKPSVVDWRAMPGAIFTDPELSMVGMNEAQAKEAGHEVTVGKFPFSASGRALAAAETDGFVKVVADAKDGALLGVFIAGMEASNLIAEAALAIEAGLTAEDLALTVHAHPTLPEGLMEAAEAAIGKAIHVIGK